ncbi:MAG: YraN family protein [Candidatus Adiutrix sp.]|jgi:putative endonuclease|nr:YraN family protein [Candidatus Adiutrix sp.]
MDKRRELGRRGEELAARHLRALGYLIVGLNIVNQLGELDIVAVDGATVVIVEVKTRGRPGLAPGLAVNSRKQRKLSQVAALFLKARRWENRPARFDVVEVVCPVSGAPLVNHIKNAFDLAE